MKKKLIVGLLAAVLVVGASVGIYATMNNDAYPDIASCCASIEALDGYIGIEPMNGSCGSCRPRNPLANPGQYPCDMPGIQCSAGWPSWFSCC